MKLKRAKTRTDYKKIKKLYLASFPKCERKPFWLIKRKQRQGLADIWYLEKDREFAGLAITMNAKDLVLLDYFAIAENQRANGLGSKVLKYLRKHYRGKRFFLEIESTHGKADNMEQRRRRKKFYLANGMTEIGIMADVFGTQMELLGYECHLTFLEYLSVYREVYGIRKAGKLKWITEEKKYS